MRFVTVDLKRAFTERAFWLCVLAGCVLAAVSLAAALQADGGSAASDLFRAAQSLLLVFTAPILAAIPYSGMLMSEEETGYGLMMREKLGEGGYEFRRFLVTGLTGGMSLMLPELFLWGGCLAAGMYTHGGAGPDAAGIPGVMLLNFASGFCFAGVSYGLGFLNRKRYLPVVMPQVFYLLFTYAFPYLGLTSCYPPLLVSPWAAGAIERNQAHILLAAMLLFGLACTGAGKAMRLWRERRK